MFIIVPLVNTPVSNGRMRLPHDEMVGARDGQIAFL